MNHRPDESPAIDLSRHHFMYPFKDLVVFGTWLRNDDQDSEEPCLVVVPRYRRSGFTPAVVALSAAFKYASPDPVYMTRAAREFNAGLGFEDNMANALKVAEAIEMHLLDLLKMPPNPTTAVVVGEAGITMGGKRMTVQMLDHVAVKQA